MMKTLEDNDSETHMLLPFALPDTTDKEARAVFEVIRKGWLTSGREMMMFEGEIASWLSRGKVNLHAVALNSATSGLLLALQSIAKKTKAVGFEVILPSLTFGACANTVIQAGGRPVFADVDDKTLCLTLDSIRSRVTPFTAAVILVHFGGGISPEYQQIVGWCQANNIALIEDAAHAFGSMYDPDHLVGAGDSYATVFSFYATKCITTGEGGMLVTKDKELARWVRSVRLHGIDHDVFDRYTASTPKWEYDIVEVGHKMNMSDMAAALGRVQFVRKSEMQTKRWEIASRYNMTLPSVIRRPWIAPGNCVHLYPIRLPDEIDRNMFIESMFKQGIGVSVHFKPLHLMTAFKQYKMFELPVTEKYWKSCVSLPVYSKMTQGDADAVVYAVEVALNGGRLKHV